MKRAQEGDQTALSPLVRAYLPAAYAVALAIVGREQDAEDIAQEALVRVVERIDTCREPVRFGGWLLQIVRNLAKNHLSWRRHRDEPRGAESKQPVTEGSISSEIEARETLLRALDELPSVQREVVLLHDLEGWTHLEIARALNMSEVMSRQHLFQARKSVRAALDEKGRKRQVVHE